MTTPADGFLYLLWAEPSLLPPAPLDVDIAAVERRRRGEVHACLRCGARAGCVFVAETDLGLRWLDLCWGCRDWLQRGATPAPLFGAGDD
jgi:hypothetical protein